MELVWKGTCDDLRRGSRVEDIGTGNPLLIPGNNKPGSYVTPAAYLLLSLLQVPVIGINLTQ